MLQLEDTILNGYIPLWDKLEAFGFRKQDTANGNIYLYRCDLLEEFQFTFTVTQVEEKNIAYEGALYELQSGEEYVNYRIQSMQGAYVNEVRQAYEAKLLEIRDHCFYKDYFTGLQSNELTKAIIEEYGVEPEYPWEKLDDYGVFRHPKSDKWFGIIMHIPRNKVQNAGFSDKLVEVLNIKVPVVEVAEIQKLKGVYPAYHMNKKYWISIILDQTMKTTNILELVKKSYALVGKK